MGFATSIRSLLRKGRPIVVCTLGIIVGYQATLLVRSYASSRAIPNATEGRLPNGEQWLLVYMGASWCAGSQAPSLPSRLEQAITRLRSDTADGPVSLATMGVALDWDTREGLEYLAKFGFFQELSIGRNWANEAVRRYLWDVSTDETVLPQLIVVRQEWKGDSVGLTVRREDILARISGPAAIESWADTVSGLPSSRVFEVGGESRGDSVVPHRERNP